MITDLISSLKKKLIDGYDTVADALPLVPNSSQISRAVSHPVEYFTNPTSGGGNNVYATSPFKALSSAQNVVLPPLAKAQKAIESPVSTADLIPKFNPAPNAGFGTKAVAMAANVPIGIVGSVLGKGIIDPVRDAVSNIGRTVGNRDLKTYQETSSPITRLGYQIAQNSLGRLPDARMTPGFVPTNTKEVLGNIGESAMPIVDAYSGGLARRIATRAVGGETVKQIAKRGAIEGGLMGVPAGLASGFAQNKDEKDNFEYAKNILTNLATSVGTGALIGGVLAGGSAVAQKAWGTLLNTTKRANPRMSPEQAARATSQFIRDEAGRFSGLKKQKAEPIFYGDMRESLGLPRHGNYQGGFAKLDEPVTTKPTVDPLESLKQEARKYKSVEEFVKAQGESVYHGSKSKIDEFKPYNVYSGTDATGKEISSVDGVYFTNSQSEAGRYGKNINEGVIISNAKVKKVNLMTDDARTAVLQGAAYKKKILKEIKKAKDEGFDAIEIKRSSPTKIADIKVQKMQKQLNVMRKDFEEAMTKVNDEVFSGNPTKETIEGLYKKVESKYPIISEYRRLDAELNPIHTVVFNPSQVKTKSQLTDIWNKANNGVEPNTVPVGKVAQMDQKLKQTPETALNVEGKMAFFKDSSGMGRSGKVYKSNNNNYIIEKKPDGKFYVYEFDTGFLILSEKSEKAAQKSLDRISTKLRLSNANVMVPISSRKTINSGSIEDAVARHPANFLKLSVGQQQDNPQVSKVEKMPVDPFVAEMDAINASSRTPADASIAVIAAPKKKLIPLKKRISQSPELPTAPPAQTPVKSPAAVDVATAPSIPLAEENVGPQGDKLRRLLTQIEIDKPYLGPKYTKDIFDYSEQQIAQKAGSAQNAADTDRKGFQNLFAQWIGKRDSAKTKATQYIEQIAKIPKDVSWDVVRAVEDPKVPVADSAQPFVNKVKSMYKDLYDYGTREGIDMNELQNYITHVWKQSPEEVQKILGASQRFRFSNAREIPTYEEGIKMGLTPKFTNPAQIMEEYVRRLEQTKANIDFLAQLKKKGLVVDTPVGTQGYGMKPINAQGFPKSRSSYQGQYVEGQWYAPAQIADTINRVFNPQEAPRLLGKMANISSSMQDILMSGGVPKTPANAWTFAQINKEVLSGRVRKPVAAFLRSFSDEGSQQFFSKNANQIIKMKERNIPINSTYDAAHLVDGGIVADTLGEKVSQLWKSVTSEPTFKRFMPQLQISLFNDTEKSLIASGKSAQEAADIAAEVVKRFYATTTTDKAALANPTTEALKTSLFFAPSYRQTMINFWQNNIKALKNPTALENRMNVRFVVGSTIAMLAADQLNRSLNDGRSMLDNPKGSESTVMIPLSKITGNVNDKTVIKFNPLFSLNYVPRIAFSTAKNIAQGDFKQAGREAKGLLSTPLRPIADVATNQDYFQNDIYNEQGTPEEKYMDIGKHLADQYILQHPYIKTARKYLSQTEKNPFPAYQAATEAFELPIKYTTQDKVKKQQYFQKRDDVLSGLSAEDRKVFDSLPKDKETDTQDEKSANTAIRYNTFLKNPAVFAAKRQIVLDDSKATGQAPDPLYTLPDEQARAFIAYTAASPGSYTRNTILKEAPWIPQFRQERSKYFNDRNVERVQNDLKSGVITQDQANEKLEKIKSDATKYAPKIAVKKAKLITVGKAKRRPKISVPRVKIKKINVPKIKINTKKTRI